MEKSFHKYELTIKNVHLVELSSKREGELKSRRKKRSKYEWKNRENGEKPCNDLNLNKICETSESNTFCGCDGVNEDSWPKGISKN